MIVEFVGGPLDGDVRDVNEGTFRLVHAPEPKLTPAQAAAIKLRASRYVWAEWKRGENDGKRYLKYDGEEDMVQR